VAEKGRHTKMKFIEKLRRWLEKKSLERELHAFNYFRDREGAREVLKEMEEKGYFSKKEKEEEV